MLTISSTVLESTSRHDGRGAMVEDYSTNRDDCNNFSDAFTGGGLLEDIDFDDLFVGFDEGDDALPDLEVDPNELLAEFSSVGREEYSGTTSSAEVKNDDEDRSVEIHGRRKDEEEEEEEEEEDGKSSDQTVPETEEGRRLSENNSSAVVTGTDNNKDRNKPAVSSPSKNSQGKRKVKVDWTPELHRRFVQAVEQLGVDKAVPSRILEIMGIDCLTRHNIASHLQKYRSHRKHLLAREAEAATWSQRRHIYGGSATGGHKREMTSPWLAPTIGFPPPPPPIQPFRPLHVWGHPTVDHAMMHMWPKHLAPSRPSPPPRLHQWAQHPPPPDHSSFWHHPHYQRGPREGWMQNGAPTQGTPCYQPMPSQMRFPTQPVPVPGIPPPQPQHPTMYRPDINNSNSSSLKLDLHPSKESIDAAIGDVLLKPWLPLPLGLKPPSVDGVLVELQRQGIAKIPPSCP